MDLIIARRLALCLAGSVLLALLALGYTVSRNAGQGYDRHDQQIDALEQRVTMLERQMAPIQAARDTAAAWQAQDNAAAAAAASGSPAGPPRGPGYSVRSIR